jgi:aminoglycoside phosphotransferase (APT) family kinase protein
MVEANIDSKIEAVVRRINARGELVRTWALEGGVSAQVIGFEIRLPEGQTRKMLLRRHGVIDLKNNPHIAADEFKLLRIVQAAGIAVPTAYYLDESGSIFPTPYLVVEYIEGKTEFAPANLEDFMRQFTAELAKIHRINSADLSFLPKQAERYAKQLAERPAALDHTLQEGRIRDTLEAVWPLPQRNLSALLHGDYWPGNLLWKDGQLVAVIDWEDAALGDPLADVANSRLEILWAFGIEAMHTFTQAYQSRMPNLDYTDLPYWDLNAALRPASKLSTWGLSERVEQTMRERHHWFVGEAYAVLAGR